MPATETFTDRTVNARGLNFHVVERGAPSAPPLVFLHGITGHARTWDDEAQALAERFHVVAIDQRGHGDSDRAADGDYGNPAMVEDLAAIVDALGFRQFDLVGLSMGGRVSIGYTGGHPGRVKRLVIVDIGPDIALAGMKRVMGTMAGAPERFATKEEAAALIRLANPRYTEAKLRHRVEHGLRTLPDGGFEWKYDRELREGARQGRARPAGDLWGAWRAIDCPTLLVQGRESDILDDTIAKKMIESQPRARLAVVPEAGHTVPGDQPEAFLGLLKEFLL
ncbi:MAG: alpha/beta hydrolase [Gemmatimonadetes bacterium]|nr:alpha/beta hydrolase [Gemmatimonadota bacterium]